MLCLRAACPHGIKHEQIARGSAHTLRWLNHVPKAAAQDLTTTTALRGKQGWHSKAPIHHNGTATDCA